MASSYSYSYPDSEEDYGSGGYLDSDEEDERDEIQEIAATPPFVDAARRHCGVPAVAWH